ALAQALRFVGLDVLDAVEHAALDLQKDRPDPFGAPAFQGGFADAPTVGQLALVEVFDTHGSLRTGCCGNVRSFWFSGGGQTGGQSGQDWRADRANRPFVEPERKRPGVFGSGPCWGMEMRGGQPRGGNGSLP